MYICRLFVLIFQLGFGVIDEFGIVTLEKKIYYSVKGRISVSVNRDGCRITVDIPISFMSDPSFGLKTSDKSGDSVEMWFWVREEVNDFFYT